MARQSKADKAIDARISRAYARSCSGISISVFEAPRVFKVGREAIETGADDAALETKLRAFVDTIRVG